MKRKIISILLALVLVLSFSLVTAVPAAAEEPDWYVDASVGASGGGTSWKKAFKTIQEGVNAAGTGHTVNVAAGTYNEQVIIEYPTSNISLVGAGRDNTTIDAGSKYKEGAIDIRGASHITISGFTLRNRGEASYDRGINIVAYGFPATASSTYITVEDCTIDADEYGIRVHNYSEASHNIFRRNIITSDFSGIHLEYTSQNTVTQNTISNATGWAGINLGIAGDDNTVQYNEISGCKYGVNLVQSQGGPSGNVISNNEITNNERGIWWQRNPANVIEYNNIFNNTAYNLYAGTYFTLEAPAPAEDNWWGQDPPDTAKFYGKVDYTPWSTSPNPIVPPPVEVWVDDGFDSSTSGWGVDHFAAIQPAINAVAESGTVNVAAGEYDEKVYVNKSVTLEGAQVGQDARGRTGVSESIINPDVAYSVVVQADDVTIDGFTITSDWATNSDVAGIYVSDTIGEAGEGGTELSGVVIQNNIIHDLTDGERDGGNGILGIVVGPKTDGVEVCYNEIYNLHQLDDDYSWAPVGIMVWGKTDSTGDAKNTNVHHNKVHGISNGDETVNPRGVQFSNDVWGGTIANNEIYDIVRGRGIRLYAQGNDDIPLTGDGSVSVEGNNIHDCGDCGILVEFLATVTGNTLSQNTVSVVDRVNKYATVDDGGSIQAAIDMSEAGYTINVAAGEYDETVELKDTTATGISIIGQDKTTTFITGGIGFAADYSGLKVQHFTISGNGFLDTETYEATVTNVWPGHRVITDLEFSDCIFDGEGYDDGEGGRMGIVIKRLGGVVKFVNNEFKNYPGSATLDVNDGSGGGALPVTSYTLINNKFLDNGGGCALRGNPEDYTDTVIVTGNTFDGPAGWAALEVNRAENVEIHDNVIRNVEEFRDWGEGQAMQLWQVGTVEIYGNTIENNYQGIAILNYPDPYDISNISVHHNSFSGNAEYALSVDDSLIGGPLDAKYNWWGRIGGPGGEGLGNGDKVSTYVSYDPWLTEDYDTVITDGIRSYGSDALELQVGWNTLSVPCGLKTGKNGADTFGDIQAMGDYLISSGDDENYLGGYWFDAHATQQWKGIDTKTELEPGRGFYIRMKAASRFPVLYYDGGLYLPSYPVWEGWNLVGSMFGIDKVDGAESLDDEGDWGVASLNTDDNGDLAGDSESHMDKDTALDSLKTAASVVVSPSVPGQLLSWAEVYGTGGGAMCIGEAYWVFMLADGTLAGFEVTPFYFTYTAPAP